MRRKIIRDYIEWSRNCGKDVFYIFEETEEAIETFLKLKQQESVEEQLIKQMQLFEHLEVMLENGQNIKPDSLIRSQIQRTIGKNI